jgi:hypothetical protein
MSATMAIAMAKKSNIKPPGDRPEAGLPRQIP